MIYFVDLEASSLDRGSFPIEIGWMSEDGVGESHLIRPEPEWTEWSAQSEAIHGITQEQLARDGKPATWVALRVLDVLSPDTAVGISDSPAFDQFWLGMLLDVVRKDDHPVLIELTHLLKQDLQPLINLLARKGMASIEIKDAVVGLVNQVEANEKSRYRKRHRALPDAEGLHWRCRELRRRVEEATFTCGYHPIA